MRVSRGRRFMRQAFHAAAESSHLFCEAALAFNCGRVLAVARGMTNPRIEKRLYVIRRIEGHIQRIYVKKGVHSKKELTVVRVERQSDSSD